MVRRSELLRVGITPEEIRQRLQKGVLSSTYRGVYRVGHRAPSREARYLAAVLACGEGALLSGRAAAHLWGLLKGTPPIPEVVAPNERRIAGVITHRERGSDLTDAAECRGIPATSVPRTLVDLAGSVPMRLLTRACHEADVLHGMTPDQVEAVLARRPSAKGAAKLRRVIHGETKITLSGLEERFLALLEKEGIEEPQTNRRAGGRRVDCRWPNHRLTVELDGYRYHRTRQSWELDRRREREARLRGDEFRRYTWADVCESPAFMLNELRALLSRSLPG